MGTGLKKGLLNTTNTSKCVIIYVGFRKETLKFIIYLTQLHYRHDLPKRNKTHVYFKHTDKHICDFFKIKMK